MDTVLISELKDWARTRFLALLAYLGILCLVPLVLSRNNEFVNFHARQGLILWIWEVLGLFALNLPVIGKFFFSFTTLVTALFSLLGVISVTLGRAWKFPLIGNWAAKI